jgi:hypothetical protein
VSGRSAHLSRPPRLEVPPSGARPLGYRAALVWSRRQLAEELRTVRGRLALAAAGLGLVLLLFAAEYDAAVGLVVLVLGAWLLAPAVFLRRRDWYESPDGVAVLSVQRFHRGLYPVYRIRDHRALPLPGAPGHALRRAIAPSLLAAAGAVRATVEFQGRDRRQTEVFHREALRWAPDWRTERRGIAVVASPPSARRIGRGAGVGYSG